LQAIGNVLTLFQNGFQVLQVEDEANLLTSGSPGFAMYRGTLANAQVSAWDGGNAGVIPYISVRRKRLLDICHAVTSTSAGVNSTVAPHGSDEAGPGEFSNRGLR